MRYFKLEEFECPSEPGTGCMMCPDFLELLDEASIVERLPAELFIESQFLVPQCFMPPLIKLASLFSSLVKILSFLK